MKIKVAEDRSLILSNVYNGVGFEREDNGQQMSVCECGEGFEINVNGQWYRTDGQRIIPMVGSKIALLHNADADRLARWVEFLIEHVPWEKYEGFREKFKAGEEPPEKDKALARLTRKLPWLKKQLLGQMRRMFSQGSPEEKVVEMAQREARRIIERETGVIGRFKIDAIHRTDNSLAMHIVDRGTRIFLLASLFRNTIEEEVPF